MRICLYGAGAIGGYVAALLTRAGTAQVTCIARGSHLEAMQANGLSLRIDGETFVTHPRCTDDPGEAGPQDFVIITLKSHSVPAILPHLPPLLGPETAVVTAMNGIPWWYFYNDSSEVGQALAGTHLNSVDPGGDQWSAIGPERAIGCAPWPSCEVVEPGVIQHEFGNRLALGEPNGERSPRVTALSDVLTEAGLKAPALPNIRAEIWVKLLGNLSFNPISALTHAPLNTIAEEPATRTIVVAMMEEARAVATALGVKIAMSNERRIKAAAAVGNHKTSMLQDLNRGRALEIEALVGAVAEMGRLVDVPTPTIDTIYTLVQQRASQARLSSPKS
ncbi:MAG TPA: 2-dehydropantoate 2-reductase [Dehalococcoidia bacterium]|nr:2-dehydropantoate 2-reductase [Dehalococcoidia bacterium]